MTRSKLTSPRPTRKQYRQTRAVVRWYLDNYHWTAGDVGVAKMFCDQQIMNHFAIKRGSLKRGEGKSLFKMMVATTMFQRRQDLQIIRFYARSQLRLSKISQTRITCWHC